MPFPYKFTFPFETPDTERRRYFLDIRDASGNLARFVGSPINPSVRHAVNEPHTLTFACPFDDPAANALMGNNEIWVRDQEENISGKFRITRRSESSSAAGTLIEVEGVSYMAQLADEWLFDFTQTEQTVSTILTALIAAQVQENKITLGTISATIGNLTRSATATTSQPRTILEIINVIESSLAFNSQFWVDNDRALHWLPSSEVTDEGLQIHLRSTLKSLRRTIDTASQITRLYVFGANVKGRRIRLSDEDGVSVDYVDYPWVTHHYRKAIVIDHTDIDGRGETDYDLHVDESADPDLAAHTNFSGSDIKFLADDLTTQLSSVTNSYTKATGALDANVTVPLASGVSDTVVYMIYGLVAPP